MIFRFDRQENTIYYETKIQRLTKALDDKEQEMRALNMQLITFVVTRLRRYNRVIPSMSV
jgi:hypothetical protein